MSQQAFENMICHLFFKINDRDECFFEEKNKMLASTL